MSNIVDFTFANPNKPMAPEWEDNDPITTGGSAEEIWVTLRWKPVTHNVLKDGEENPTEISDLQGYSIWQVTSEDNFAYLGTVDKDTHEFHMTYVASLRGVNFTYMIQAENVSGVRSDYSERKSIIAGR